MKPYHQQTYYELLEISPSATEEEIRAAYERQMQNYAPDSVAIYSLADPAQAEDLRKRILEAFEYLSDPDLRAEYDRTIGIDPAKRAARTTEAAPAAPRQDPKGEPPPPPEQAAEEEVAPRPPAEPPQPEAAAADVPRAQERELAQARRESVASPPAAGAEAPSQLAMSEILNDSVAVASSNFPKVSVSYIPRPPRPEREAMTLAAPSWAVGELPAEPASTPRPRTESAERRLESAAAPPPEPFVPQLAPPVPNLTPPPMPPVAVAPLPGHTPPAIAPAAVAAPPNHTPPPGPPPHAEPVKPPPVAEKRRGEPLAVAPEIAQEAAIANAEAALAQVASRLREPRPKPFEVPPDAEFNGELLRKIRQSKGLSIQQVADRTKISSRHLENLEADRYDELPTTVYLRGILMNVAREYGLDPLRVSKGYLALVPAKK